MRDKEKILDCLKTLNIKTESDTVSLTMINKARRQLAAKYHPDKNSTISDDYIKKINAAHGYLVDQATNEYVRIPREYQSYRHADRPSSERFTSSSSYRPSSSRPSRQNAWGETFEDIQARYKSDRDNYNKHRQSGHSNGYSNSGSRESQYTTGTQGRPSSERFTSSSSYGPSSSRPSPATNAYGGTFEGIPKFRADRDTYRKSHQSRHGNGYSNSGSRESQYTTGTQGRPSSERFTSSSSYRPSSSRPSPATNAYGGTFEGIPKFRADRDTYRKSHQSRHGNGYSNSGSRESQYTTGTQGRPSSERFTSSSSYRPSSSRPSRQNAWGETFEDIQARYKSDRDNYNKHRQSGHSNGYSNSGSRESQYTTGTQGRPSRGSPNTTSSEFARESARMNEEILNARRAYEEEKKKSSDAADNLRRFLDQAQREGKIKSETGQSYFERFMPQHSNAKDRSWEKFFTSHTPDTSSSSQARM